MRTLIVSDLHLGSRKHGDLLRRPEQREVLLSALERDVERLVLLGDVFELRHGPARDALAAGRGFFEDLGRRFAGREVVLLAGNHDHALVAPWLERRRRDGPPAPLGLETRAQPQDVSPAVAQLAEWAAGTRLSVAYPGVWVREDVYATHGHYLDVRLTLPTFERMGAGIVGRLLGAGEPPHTAEGYDAQLAPLYAWVDAIAQQAPTGRMLNGSGTVGAWRMVSGRGRRRVLSLSAAAAFPLAVAALNRAGLGPLRAEVSGDELRRGALRAMGATVDSLGIEAAHVVFGHTHRSGPLPGDLWHEWGTRGGTRLINSGSWIFETHFMTRVDADSPYWPGGGVVVERSGPPRLERLLADAGHEQLRAAGTAAST